VPVTGESEMALPAMTARFRFSVSTDVGLERKVNEDSFWAHAPVFLVADGMGGHAHGDTASQAVVRVFDEHISRNVPSTPEQVLDAIHSANDAVRDLSAIDDVGTAVSGTTLAGVAFVDAGDSGGFHWMAFNIGDSRVYTWDGRSLVQLSVDHSAVQEMVDAGLISAADAETHPERNIITRALGAEEFVDADVWLLPAAGTHSFLICSDGLTKELDHEAIARTLARYDESIDVGQTVADVLVAAALAHGGHDNVTVVVVESAVGDGTRGEDDTRDRPPATPEQQGDTRPRSRD
jgi:PPM family protein phosphatase